MRVPFTTVSRMSPQVKLKMPMNTSATAKSAEGSFGTSPVAANSQTTGTPATSPSTQNSSATQLKRASGR